MQVGLDDAQAQGLGGILVATMTFLLTQELGGETLHVVKGVEQRVAEKLGQDQRANDETKAASLNCL
jgi:hypothetical protein